MKKGFKAFIAFVMAFVVAQGVYAASGAYIKPGELRSGSIASGNMIPVVRVTPRPEKVTPTPKPTPTPEPFYSDVAEDEWYYAPVKAVTQKKYMDGTGDEELIFEPDTKLTRAMFVTILYRVAGSPEVKKAAPAPRPTATPKPTNTPEPSLDEEDDEASATPAAAPKATEAPASFNDVEDDIWYSDAVAWATAAKIADGIDANRFSPDKEITREQAVVMLYRYAQYKKTDTSKEANLLKYKDYAEIGEYAIDAFGWACGMGIINGAGDSKMLEPASGVTRAQAAKMIATYTGDMSNAAEKPDATETPRPTSTPAPTATPTPAATPAATMSPGATATPAATPAPGATATPAATPAPGAAATPAATLAPGATATPAATLAP